MLIPMHQCHKGWLQCSQIASGTKSRGYSQKKIRESQDKLANCLNVSNVPQLAVIIDSEILIYAALV